MLGFDGVTASHLTVPSDAFSAAVLEDGFGGRIPCYKAWIVGLTTKPFRAESGLLLQPQATLETVPPLDTIIVPGGESLRRPELCEELAEWILSRASVIRRIASICRGVAVLAPTGLLDGRDVTTHWYLARELAQRYPTLRVHHKRRLIRDGPFYTSAGLTGGVNLALALIEEDYGKGVALAVGRNLMTYLATEDLSHEARRRLSSRRNTLRSVAQSVGFTNPDSFRRPFQRRFGKRPASYLIMSQERHLLGAPSFGKLQPIATPE